MKIEQRSAYVGMRVNTVKVGKSARGIFSGADFSSRAVLLKDYGNGWLMVKINGGSAWAGVGMVGYDQPRYYLIKVIKGMVAEVWCGEFGKSPRQGIKELESKMKENE